MAQVLRFEAECDVHPGTEGDRYELTLNGKSRVVYLCYECASAFLGPAVRVMEKFGRWASRDKVVVKRPFRSAVGEFPCNFPTCAKSYKHKRSLRAHVREEHDMTLTELYRKHGDEGTRIDAPERAGIYVCPDCGDEFSRNQGLGYHRRKIHGVVERR